MKREISLAEGNCVLFHSDGLVEAHNPRGEMFGFPRLRTLVAEHGEERTLRNLRMRPVKCVKVPCRSTPQCSLARHQLRLFGQLLLPSIQLRQGSGAEIAF